MRYALCVIIIGGIKSDPAAAIAYRNGFWNLRLGGSFSKRAFFVKRVAKYHGTAFAVVRG